MRNDLGDKARLQHILDAIEDIDNYLKEVEFSVFLESSMMRFTSIKQMEIIGEASNHLSSELNQNFQKLNGLKLLG